jgi:hypothetical protein
MLDASFDVFDFILLNKVFKSAHLISIMITGMPIKMYHGQAVHAFVPDPGFSALRFVAVQIGQAMREQLLMNSVMRDMLSMCELDNLFQPSCAQILLFVDASTASKLSLMLISETSRISFTDSSSKVFSFFQIS